MMKTNALVLKCWLLGCCLSAFFPGNAQEEGIRWLTVVEAEKQCQQAPKPYLFDVYTDWCGWCKHLDKTTYADPVVISFVNRYFYPVKVNAESADTVVFQGKVYPPVGNGNKKLNGFAVEMLGGKMSYPTTVFKYDTARVNLVVPGYIDVLKMEGFLVYFAESAYRSADVNTFLADFEQVFGKEKEQQANGVDYWTSFQELEKKRKAEKKKILLFLEASWNNSSRMMEKVVFPDSLFSARAQEYFYCLHLDVQSTDTLTFMTHHFRNAGAENNNLHQLAIALSDRTLKVPGIYLFDEEGKLMDRLYFYIDKERGGMILDYIGSDVFKTMSWNEYLRMKSREKL